MQLVKFRNLVPLINVDGNWGKQRTCTKCSILDVAGILCPLLRESLHEIHQKRQKVRFLCFYFLSTKIQSMTVLPAKIYKFFYLPAIVVDIFRLLMVYFFETLDLFFVKQRYCSRFTYSFVLLFV